MVQLRKAPWPALLAPTHVFPCFKATAFFSFMASDTLFPSRLCVLFAYNKSADNNTPPYCCADKEKVPGKGTDVSAPKHKPIVAINPFLHKDGFSLSKRYEGQRHTPYRSRQ